MLIDITFQLWLLFFKVILLSLMIVFDNPFLIKTSKAVFLSKMSRIITLNYCCFLSIRLSSHFFLL